MLYKVYTQTTMNGFWRFAHWFGACRSTSANLCTPAVIYQKLGFGVGQGVGHGLGEEGSAVVHPPEPKGGSMK